MNDAAPFSSESQTFLTDPQHLASPPHPANLDSLGDSDQQVGDVIDEAASADEPFDAEPPDPESPLPDALQVLSAEVADGISSETDGEPRPDEPILSDPLPVATEELATELEPEANAQSEAGTDDHPADPVLGGGLESVTEQVVAAISDQPQESVLADDLRAASGQIAAEVSEQRDDQP
jgi:hypothetical protein